jgi:uncharacterized protein YceK
MRLASLLLTLLLMIVLSGCNSIRELTGTYTAPVLSNIPRSSGCSDERCRTLDAIEANGYEQARQGKIKWVKLVDDYYQKRTELYPNSRDDNGVNEYRAYQKVLAEQMDLGKISEAVWVYQLESKIAEIRTRNQALANTAPRQTNCTTTQSGTSYRTTCD